MGERGEPGYVWGYTLKKGGWGEEGKERRGEGGGGGKGEEGERRRGEGEEGGEERRGRRGEGEEREREQSGI